jgi:hypothetical protein
MLITSNKMIFYLQIHINPIDLVIITSSLVVDCVIDRYSRRDIINLTVTDL